MPRQTSCGLPCPRFGEKERGICAPQFPGYSSRDLRLVGVVQGPPRMHQRPLRRTIRATTRRSRLVNARLPLVKINSSRLRCDRFVDVPAIALFAASSGLAPGDLPGWTYTMFWVWTLIVKAKGAIDGGVENSRTGGSSNQALHPVRMTDLADSSVAIVQPTLMRIPGKLVLRTAMTSR